MKHLGWIILGTVVIGGGITATIIILHKKNKQKNIADANIADAKAKVFADTKAKVNAGYTIAADTNTKALKIAKMYEAGGGSSSKIYSIGNDNINELFDELVKIKFKNYEEGKSFIDNWIKFNA